MDARDLEVREIGFDAEREGPQRAVVLAPRWGSPGQTFPVLIALHGRGEANRGLEVGAWGWTRDYWLDRTMLRLRRPPLTADDLLGLATPRYLDKLNRTITKQPLRGLVVVCPHTPDILATRDLDAAEPFSRFVVDSLLDTVRKQFPAMTSASATGIDGVSLGGRMALLCALEQPRAFGCVGTLQAAIHDDEVSAIADRATTVWRNGGAPHALRLLTSDRDPFRPTLHKLAIALGGGGVPVTYEVVPGPHDYDFNRGPGGYDMLLWHDRVLRGEPPPEASAAQD